MFKVGDRVKFVQSNTTYAREDGCSKTVFGVVDHITDSDHEDHPVKVVDDADGRWSFTPDGRYFQCDTHVSLFLVDDDYVAEDIENKDIENKDIENKDIENKDIENKDIDLTQDVACLCKKAIDVFDYDLAEELLQILIDRKG